jgi:glutathione synthase/RimK-type ligase-like ATP-grasp enzyme
MLNSPSTFRCAQARYAAHAAARAGLSFRSLDGDDGYLFEITDGARRALFSSGAGSPYALNDFRAASLARDKAFCATVLSQSGLPTIPGDLFFVTEQHAAMRAPGRELADARAFARTAVYPLFCKPVAASNGAFAERIADAAAFQDYLTRVARQHFAILAQPFLRGAEHRVFVLEGRALFAYRKHLPHVIGDGRATLAELLQKRGYGRAGVGRALDVVPAEDERIELEGPANRAVGGAASAPVDDVPEPLARIAFAAADTLGLQLAGIDIFDLSAAGDYSDLRIIECNANPMIATLEDHDRWDLIDTIWRANIAAALR